MTEVLVAVAATVVIAGIAFLMLHGTKIVPRSPRDEKNFKIRCINNLKQDVLAYKMWANDNGDKYPQQVTAAKGGAMETAQDGNVASIFKMMSNELSTPKILVCPADAHHSVAKNFSKLDNSGISYFASLSASDDQPQTILIGDDNFAIGSKAVKSGLLNFSTSASISWTAERHRNPNDVGAGNLGLADGSVQYTTTASMRTEFDNAVTNCIAIP